MVSYKKKVIEASDFIKSQIKKIPEIGIQIGTGLKDSVKSIKVEHIVEYKNIPNFPVPTVVTHSGKLLIGNISNKNVIIMQGRFHLYEGYTSKEVAFPIRVLKELGIKDLILTNAAGGINKNFTEGDIMIITDHINLTGENPLVGSNEDAWGQRFPDMTNIYYKNLNNISEKKGIKLQKGIYAGLKGPCLETPAEIKFLKTIGADAVGLSTIQEAIAAKHANIKIIGLSVITNILNPDMPIPTNVEKIIKIAQNTAPKLDIIIQEIISQAEEVT